MSIVKWLDDFKNGLENILKKYRLRETEDLHIAKMTASAILYKIIVINGKQGDEKELFYRFYKSEFDSSAKELDEIYEEAQKIEGSNDELMQKLNHLLNGHKNLKLNIITHMNNYAQLEEITADQRKLFEQAIEILSSFEE